MVSASEGIARPIEILLVEDNPGDVVLMEEALETMKMRNNLRVVNDGMEAMAYLRKEGAYADATRPDLILLDLNLPKKDGREVLCEIKGEPTLRCIPVVVLTTSKAEQDVLKAYECNANCYITKPVDLAQFMIVVQNISQFWLSIVVYPPK